jgi:hypothetical protein
VSHLQQELTHRSIDLSFGSWGSGGQSETDTSQSHYDDDEEETEAEERRRMKPSQRSPRVHHQKRAQRSLSEKVDGPWGDHSYPPPPPAHRSRGDSAHDRCDSHHSICNSTTDISKISQIVLIG